MKKYLSIIVISYLHIVPLYAQKPIATDRIVNDGAIYLNLDSTKLSYFTLDKRDHITEVDENTCFALKYNNSGSIYMRWINPLKYRLVWRDTVYADENVKAINEFVTLLSALPGLSFLKDSSLSSTEALLNSDALYIPENGFYNPTLNLLYLQLRAHKEKITEDELDEINALTEKVEELDSLIARNISNEMDELFIGLLEITDPLKVPAAIEKANIRLELYGTLLSKVDILHKELVSLLPKVVLTDKLLNNYLQAILSDFLNQGMEINRTNKYLTTKLKPVINVLDNSVSPRIESQSPSTKGYYRIRNITFEEGMELQTHLTITEFEYKKEKKEFLEKKKLVNAIFTFRSYDPVAVTFSTGIFYSNTTLRGYGVSNNTTGGFTIIEDDITKNTVIEAAFLNFNFRKGSRYINPLVQLGLSSAKLRPLLLFGVGFAIPTSRIAFSGGPIWAWNQTLDKLSVGQSISSTTELEEDIQYKFDIEPKGWYFGIQINF